jgi:hypothetical protein
MYVNDERRTTCMCSLKETINFFVEGCGSSIRHDGRVDSCTITVRRSGLLNLLVNGILFVLNFVTQEGQREVPPLIVWLITEDCCARL